MNRYECTTVQCDYFLSIREFVDSSIHVADRVPFLKFYKVSISQVVSKAYNFVRQVYNVLFVEK
jgi:hypothetical protein